MIDGAKALETFRKQMDRLCNLISYSLFQMSIDLYAKSIISKETYDNATNESFSPHRRTAALLDGMESRIRESPSDFREIICILESDPFLSRLADGLVRSYNEKLKKSCSSEFGIIQSEPCIT